jgi:amidase
MLKMGRLTFALACLSVSATLALDVAPAAPGREPFAVEEATIADIQKALMSKRVTAVELVRLYLERIKAFNGTCVHEPEGILGPISTIPHAGKLNALITLNLRPQTRAAWGFDERKARSITDPGDDDPNMPDAFEVAAVLDAHFAMQGKLVGPLHGVVMAIKDQYDTFDMRTGGCRCLLGERSPARRCHVREAIARSRGDHPCQGQHGGICRGWRHGDAELVRWDDVQRL